jgi:enoyl-[acyl-carrier-protein] reductase (NADH)
VLAGKYVQTEEVGQAHAYVLAPLAVNVTGDPAQIVLADEAMVTVGLGFTVTAIV